MRPSMKALSVAATSAALAWTTLPEAATAVSVPLSCDQGPSGQHADLLVTVPSSVPEGGTFTVRIDGRNSGKISHMGLRYIHDMTTEVLLPSGAGYVDGSARIVPKTGSPNVRPGASVTRQGNAITLVLPAHVEDGSDYTPPSFEFELRATAAAGAKIVQRFSQYRVTAKAIIVGDVHTVCDSVPKPYAIGSTTVTSSPAQP